jgi:hypothetical protein
MSKKTLASAALVLIILGALASAYRNLRPEGIPLGPYDALGIGAGDATAKLLHNQGKVVLVDAEFGRFKLLAPTTEAQIHAFKKTVGRTGLKVVAIEKVPIARPSMARNGIFMQPGQMSGVLARHPDADAIVLLVGLSGPADLGEPPAGKPGPKLVVVANFEPYLKGLVEKRALAVVIAPRSGVDAEADPKIRDPRQWFNQHYEVLVAETSPQPAQ